MFVVCCKTFRYYRDICIHANLQSFCYLLLFRHKNAFIPVYVGCWKKQFETVKIKAKIKYRITYMYVDHRRVYIHVPLISVL